MSGSDDLQARFVEAARSCGAAVFGPERADPGERLAALARGWQELGLDRADRYGSGGPVDVLEARVAELLGKPAAAFFPSGIMAQQATLRVWCDRSGSRRVALPDLSHLLRHEDDGPALLHGLRMEHLTVGRRTPAAEDLRALDRGLGAVLVELPLREAGCLLPSWDDLAELSGVAHELRVPLHFDGARLWESQAHYDRPLADIAGLADSVYVSFYKGLGAMAGACVAGPEDVLAEARRWRRRLGGTLFQLTPYAVGALLGLRDRLPRMGEYVDLAHLLAAELASSGLRVHPDPPHTNTFEVFVDGDADEINARVIAVMERDGVQPCGMWRRTEVPDVAGCELAVQQAALDHDPKDVVSRLVEVARP